MCKNRNHTPGQRAERDNAKNCAFCCRKLDKKSKQHAPWQPTIDHFYPLDIGEGLNFRWNKVVICRRCNQLKGNKTPQQFIDHCYSRLNGLCDWYQVDLRCIIVNVGLLLKEKEGYYLMRDIL